MGCTCETCLTPLRPDEVCELRGRVLCGPCFDQEFRQLRARETSLPLQALGDVLGPLRYLGQCPDCGAQHASTHDRVLVRGHQNVCERCARKAVA